MRLAFSFLFLTIVKLCLGYTLDSSFEHLTDKSLRGIAKNLVNQQVIEKLKESPVSGEASLRKERAAPVLILYPMHESCEFRTTNYFEQTLNTYARCIEVSTDESWLVNRLYDVRAHGERLCEEVRNDENFKHGNFSIVSFSLGGMMARYIIEYCPLDMPIRNVVTLGAPLNGISAVSHMPRESWIGSIVDWIVDKLIYYDIMDRVLEPADFWRDPEDHQGYLEHSRFLAEANNEVNFKEERRSAWRKVGKAMFIKWENDQTIIPAESAWWGQYDEDFRVLCRHETEIFQDDLIGIRYLEEQQKSQYVTFPGDHMQFNFTQINEYVLPVLRN